MNKIFFKILKICKVRIVNYFRTSSVFGKSNNTITVAEIKKAIQSLKSKKTPGKDGITNEMIKSSGESLMKSIQELFNQIFNSGYYPQAWNQNVLFWYINQVKKTIPIFIGVLLFAIVWENFWIQFYINALKKIWKSRKFFHQHSADLVKIIGQPTICSL